MHENEIYDRYVGNLSPVEWVDMMDGDIDDEVNVYLDEEPAATWLRESGDDRATVHAAICRVLTANS